MTSTGERALDRVRACGKPSDLRITDLRLAVVASNYDYPLLRIDTNQGLYGLGEVRDAGDTIDALRFKSLHPVATSKGRGPGSAADDHIRGCCQGLSSRSRTG